MAAQDAAFERVHAPSCQVGLILTGPQVFAAIADEQRLVGLHKYALQDTKVTQLHRQHLEQLYREVDWLRWPFRSVQVASWDAPFTLVPESFHQVSLEEVGALMHGQPNEWARSATPAGFEVAFHAEKGLQEWVAQSFDVGQLSHPFSSLLPYLKQQRPLHEGKQIHVHVHATRLAIVALDHNTIQLANTFSYQSQDDFLYYCLLAYEQLGYDPEEDPIVLSGEITRDGQLYPLLYRYVRDIRFATWPKQWIIGDFAGHLPAHFYLDLLALLA